MCIQIVYVLIEYTKSIYIYIERDLQVYYTMLCIIIDIYLSGCKNPIELIL